MKKLNKIFDWLIVYLERPVLRMPFNWVWCIITVVFSLFLFLFVIVVAVCVHRGKVIKSLKRKMSGYHNTALYNYFDDGYQIELDGCVCSNKFFFKISKIKLKLILKKTIALKIDNIMVFGLATQSDFSCELELFPPLRHMFIKQLFHPRLLLPMISRQIKHSIPRTTNNFILFYSILRMRNINSEGMSNKIKRSSFQPPVFKILYFVKTIVDITFFIQYCSWSIFDNEIRFLLKVKETAKLGHCNRIWK